MSTKDEINDIINLIFSFKINGLKIRVLEILQSLRIDSIFLDEVSQEDLKTLIQDFSIALENSDFLLVADLFQYEILPKLR
jgi:hypothetical protein